MLKPADFSEDVKPIIEWIQRYLNEIESYPVKSQVEPRDIYNSFSDSPPAKAVPIQSMLSELNEKVLPGITHWQHPNFHAYFPSSRSIESMFAEMITATMGVQGMIWDTSPAAAELEEKMMDWLKVAMNLPSNWTGVIQDSASSSTLVAILTAREVKTNFESNKKGVPNNLRVYCSDQVHSSIEKGAKIAGLGSDNVVKIKTDENMALIAAELEQAIQSDIANNKVPCCVVAAFGTTSTLGIDPIRVIGEICEKYNIWYHIDAAYAGTALLLPEYQWMVDGMEHADSFVFNPHKWMFTNFDCSCYYVKDPEVLKQTFEILPEYLKTGVTAEINNYRDWGIPLGRRFRALKLWFVLQGIGLEGIQAKLRDHIALNNEFVRMLKDCGEFELLAKPMFNLTCFRYHPSNIDNEAQLTELNQRLVSNINKGGEAYLSHTTIKEKYALRFLPSSTYIEMKHVKKAFEIIKYQSDMLL